jgi:multidrug efflux system membrane fusion protein
VRLTVRLAVEPNVTAIPSKAIFTGQKGPSVFVLDKGDEASLRVIEAGRTVGELTTVSQGITPGERVVVNGQSRLVNGTRVAIRSSITTKDADKGAGK